MRAARGVVNAVLFSFPLWALIALPVLIYFNVHV